MRRHWLTLIIPALALLACSGSNLHRKYDTQAAPEFLFEQSPSKFDCLDRTPGQFPKSLDGRLARPRFVEMPANQPPYSRTHAEHVTLPASEAPNLTIVADASNEVSVVGSDRKDLVMSFCARGDGNSEAEAVDHQKQVNMTRQGTLISLNRLSPEIAPYVMSSFLLESPADEQLVINGSFAPVEVRDMSGPVRVATSHARAQVFNTTGLVDVDGFVIDFAGSKGNVTLTASDEINVKITETKFDGSFSASAQRAVRVLLPPGFATPFVAYVNRTDDFVCRTDFCAKMRRKEAHGLYAFTYTGDGSATPDRFNLRSEEATVVIDNVTAKK